MNERQILALLKTGQVAFRYPLKLHYQAGTGQFGVSVPKRHFKRAVKRNLLKRRMRAAFLAQKERFDPTKWDIFIYYIGKEEEDYGRIEKSLVALLDDLATN